MRSRFLILSVVFAFACGGDGSTGPTQVSVAGTWNLQTVNGSNLPFVVAQTGTDKVELVSDVLTAVPTGSFTDITTIRNTVNGQVTTESEADAGSYTLNGTAVTFTFNSDGSTGTGSISGNTLTVSANGLAAVYKKQ
jgi:hypothetical protein